MPPDPLALPFSGAVLREIREEAGLTRPALAQKCEQLGSGVTPQHIGRIEKGRHIPQAPTLKALAEALGVSPRAFAPRQAGAA